MSGGGNDPRTRVHHGQPQQAPGPAVQDGFVDLSGRRLYRITDYDRMPPFFMTVVGAGDPWLFVSSTGGLTAGRVRPDCALFPYYTDDKVSEGAGRTGGLSLLRVASTGGGSVLWEPFWPARRRDPNVVRTLYKDALSTTVVFEEVRTDLGLRLRVRWQTSSRFGIVRTCELDNLGAGPCEVEIVDGVVDVLPAGVDVAVQNRLSNLLDAYKRSELDPATGLGIYSLSSRLTDLAEPSESLRANVVWSVGLRPDGHLLSTEQLPRFANGAGLAPEHDVRGLRGAYLTHARLSLDPGELRRWHVVGDVEQDAADVVGLRDLLTRPDELTGDLAADVEAGRADLERIVAAADGLQATGDELASAHHAANVLFNVMRGGLPVDGYRIDAADVRRFVAERSPATSRRCARVLDGLPARLPISELLAQTGGQGDPDLTRLALEYLPFTFSRRHGDPSRPWNTFEIVLRDAGGEPRLNYQGNWRDIFQNWEALAWSYPEYVESMVAVFIDATTADGYNPYRISRSGIDWEVPEPGNPWANIGYWGDHQIVYLLRLLETSRHFHPGRLEALRGSAIFTHADVPYRIAGYAQIVADPYQTISFDERHAALVAERVRLAGADGRLVHGPDGDLVRVTLTEKLLLLLLAKVVNLVPDGGIWMNTQRPEWNDANNALVGRGLSVVTLSQLRRYVDLVAELLTVDVQVTEEVGGLLEDVLAALDAHAPQLEQGFTDTTRRDFLDAVGTAGQVYRDRVYAGFSGARTGLPSTRIQELLAHVRAYVDASLRANRRADGLYHSYNILDLAQATASVSPLSEMLEGQVAMLGSGQLSAQESVELLDGLRHSRLHRDDQHSYMLYPDKDLPGFLERNRIPADRAAGVPLLGAVVEAGDRSLVVRDVHGDLHWAAGIRNARDVEAALATLADRPGLADLAAAGRADVLELFEEVFRHAEFTGRSGTFFAFEGLGSIYWHMVSKLLLAVQETWARAVADGEPAETVQALADAYEDVRAGLGYCKSAAQYGAFPVDPYSHTPAGHGARQPGMTGQVKEEVITRLGELGLTVQAGRIAFRPLALREREWVTAPTTVDLVDVRGERVSLDLGPGSLAFTFCQVPVVYHRAGQLMARVQRRDGTVVECPGARLGAELSASVFRRLGEVERIDVDVPGRDTPAPA